ncbi:MAG: hypothetical protein CVU59_01575 [Deltaproteobacteria bacterium HGW-Deltaproteobacteria-17]|nr:MAG: hypothetical protein CVU59_01575 [Deltaproteobacteria bacterium HGW-Deltaproteobacteria-17]
MTFERVAVLWLGAFLLSGGSCSVSRNAKHRSTFSVFSHAAGATGLHRSPKGNWWVAELRGRWLEHAWGLGVMARPGLVKLVSFEKGVRSAVRGFAMGAPDDQGRFLWVQEHDDEYEYHVHASDQGSLALSPPAEGYWFFQSAHHDQRTGCAVVVLEQPVVRGQRHRERIWIASVDPVRLTIKATTTLDAALPEDGHTGIIGVATAVGGTKRGSGVFTLASLPMEDSTDGAFTLTTLSCETLKPLWKAPVPMVTEDAGARATVEHKVWENRVFKGVRVAYTGTGQYLAVVYGRAGLGTLRPQTLSFLDMATGRVERVDASQALILSYCTQLVAVHGRDAVLALALPKVRNVGDFVDTFFGVYEYALQGTAVGQVVDIARSTLGPGWERYRGIQPHAIGSLGGKVVLAPVSYDAIPEDFRRDGSLKSDPSPSPGDDEVTPWLAQVKLRGPSHQDSRVRVKEAASWLSTLPSKE